MIEKISYRLFTTFMLLCASTAIVLIWVQPENEQWFKLIPTLFIIGFASFLVWAPIMVYRFYGKLA